MEVLDGATIFWLIAQGMLVGAIVKVTMWNTTVDIIPNIAAGIAGSLIMGGITVALNLPGGLVFAMLGSLSILFILNVFYQETEGAH